MGKAEEFISKLRVSRDSLGLVGTFKVVIKDTFLCLCLQELFSLAEALLLLSTLVVVYLRLCFLNQAFGI